MSKLSVITLDGVTFYENYNSDTGEVVYVADHPFRYGNRNVDALGFDAFWKWVLYQSKILNAKRSGFKYSENDQAELLNEAMNDSRAAEDCWMDEECDLV